MPLTAEYLSRIADIHISIESYKQIRYILLSEKLDTSICLSPTAAFFLLFALLHQLAKFLRTFPLFPFTLATAIRKAFTLKPHTFELCYDETYSSTHLEFASSKRTSTKFPERFNRNVRKKS